VIGYGGWEAGREQWGPSPPDAQVLAAMRAGFDSGINWVDTAEIYGKGRSEGLIGHGITGWPDVLVFTKVASQPRGSGYRPVEIRRAAEASIRRLRRDVLDLYQLHWADERATPLEETWAAMAGLVDAGLVRWIGLSNVTADQMERCESIRHVDSVQPQLSMLWQERLPLVDACTRNGTGVVAYGPLAFGLLTGAIRLSTRFSSDDWRAGRQGLRAYDQLFSPARFARNLEVVDALRPVSERLGISLSQLALAWVLRQRGVTGAIVGSRSEAHVREDAAASPIKIRDEVIDEIGEILRRRGEIVSAP
jgi:aryl-alcohol dehydrogenase-like predicted oxidoreductase